jgi:hypothetical protein
VNVQLQRLIEDGKAHGQIVTDLPTSMIIGWIYCSTNVFRASYPEGDAEVWREQSDQYVDRFTRSFLRAIAG